MYVIYTIPYSVCNSYEKMNSKNIVIFLSLQKLLEIHASALEYPLISLKYQNHNLVILATAVKPISQ